MIIEDGRYIYADAYGCPVFSDHAHHDDMKSKIIFEMGCYGVQYDDDGNKVKLIRIATDVEVFS